MGTLSITFRMDGPGNQNCTVRVHHMDITLAVQLKCGQLLFNLDQYSQPISRLNLDIHHTQGLTLNFHILQARPRSPSSSRFDLDIRHSIRSTLISLFSRTELDLHHLPSSTLIFIFSRLDLDQHHPTGSTLISIIH
ncbi:hypothetical protein J6590_085398 [Homalodisca vitripennis]|nr:hypothetical protein J6590_085398 [Homalodisca vitripennis]